MLLTLLKEGGGTLEAELLDGAGGQTDSRLPYNYNTGDGQGMAVLFHIGFQPFHFVLGERKAL